MSVDALATVQDKADELCESEWPERTGRIGLAARGLIYLVVAALAMRVAVGGDEAQVDKDGALKSVASQPFGKALLVLLALGFAAHAAWRLLKAATGAGEGSGKKDGARDAARRLLDLGRAVIYVGLVATAVRVLVTSRSGPSGDDRARSITTTLMRNPAGRWLVIAVGVGLMVVGLVLVVRALRQKFERHLDQGRMSAWQRTWFPRLGTVGYLSRGAVAFLVGLFVAKAGWGFDPQDAVGIDGALERLSHQPFGPALLSAVAIGLLAFGCYSFVESRWRKVLED